MKGAFVINPETLVWISIIGQSCEWKKNKLINKEYILEKLIKNMIEFKDSMSKLNVYKL
jgi:hypothetical protein